MDISQSGQWPPAGNVLDEVNNITKLWNDLEPGGSGSMDTFMPGTPASTYTGELCDFCDQQQQEDVDLDELFLPEVDGTSPAAAEQPAPAADKRQGPQPIPREAAATGPEYPTTADAAAAFENSCRAAQLCLDSGSCSGDKVDTLPAGGPGASDDTMLGGDEQQLDAARDGTVHLQQAEQVASSSARPQPHWPQCSSSPNCHMDMDLAGNAMTMDMAATAAGLDSIGTPAAAAVALQGQAGANNNNNSSLWAADAFGVFPCSAFVGPASNSPVLTTAVRYGCNNMPAGCTPAARARLDAGAAAYGLQVPSSSSSSPECLMNMAATAAGLDSVSLSAAAALQGQVCADNSSFRGADTSGVFLNSAFVGTHLASNSNSRVLTAPLHMQYGCNNMPAGWTPALAAAAGARIAAGTGPAVYGRQMTSSCWASSSPVMAASNNSPGLVAAGVQSNTMVAGSACGYNINGNPVVLPQVHFLQPMQQQELLLPGAMLVQPRLQQEQQPAMPPLQQQQLHAGRQQQEQQAAHSEAVAGGYLGVAAPGRRYVGVNRDRGSTTNFKMQLAVNTKVYHLADGTDEDELARIRNAVIDFFGEAASRCKRNNNVQPQLPTGHTPGWLFLPSEKNVATARRLAEVVGRGDLKAFIKQC